MNYREFKASLDAKRQAAPAQASLMSAPSEQRQRIEAKQAEIKAKLDAKYPN